MYILFFIKNQKALKDHFIPVCDFNNVYLQNHMKIKCKAFKSHFVDDTFVSLIYSETANKN